MTDEKRPDPKSIDWAKKDKFRKDFKARAGFAFLVLCFGIGLIALITPIVLPLVGGYKGHYSISYFYHVEGTRDIFVGLLCATGVFLILFQGLSKWENHILSLAGVFLILVALVPTGTDQCAGEAFTWHAGFAVAFFACLFIVAIFFAKSRLDYILWPPLRKRFERLYTIAGVLMIGLPLSAYVLHFFDTQDCSHAIYWIEVGAMLSFSMYWFVKTIEYKRLLGLDWKHLVEHLKS